MGYERLGKEWIFSTKQFLILVTSSQTVLQNTALSTASSPCSQQSLNRFFSVWCTTYQDSTFYLFHFPCFWQTGWGKEAKRNPFFSALLFFFQEGCTAMFYSTQGSVQPQKNWRELYKNLTAELRLMFTHRTRFNWKN